MWPSGRDWRKVAPMRRTRPKPPRSFTPRTARETLPRSPAKNGAARHGDLIPGSQGAEVPFLRAQRRGAGTATLSGDAHRLVHRLIHRNGEELALCIGALEGGIKQSCTHLVMPISDDWQTSRKTSRFKRARSRHSSSRRSTGTHSQACRNSLTSNWPSRVSASISVPANSTPSPRARVRDWLGSQTTKPPGFGHCRL